MLYPEILTYLLIYSSIYFCKLRIDFQNLRPMRSEVSHYLYFSCNISVVFMKTDFHFRGYLWYSIDKHHGISPRNESFYRIKYKGCSQGWDSSEDVCTTVQSPNLCRGNEELGVELYNFSKNKYVYFFFFFYNKVILAETFPMKMNLFFFILFFLLPMSLTRNKTLTSLLPSNL